VDIASPSYGRKFHHCQTPLELMIQRLETFPTHLRLLGRDKRPVFSMSRYGMFYIHGPLDKSKSSDQVDVPFGRQYIICTSRSE
jgi:hypothetical protein